MATRKFLLMPKTNDVLGNAAGLVVTGLTATVLAVIAKKINRDQNPPMLMRVAIPATAFLINAAGAAIASKGGGAARSYVTGAAAGTGLAYLLLAAGQLGATVTPAPVSGQPLVAVGAGLQPDVIRRIENTDHQIVPKL